VILPKFEYHQPTDLSAALAIAARCGADFDFVAGGTDLLPNYKQRLNPRGHLISLARVREMAGIEATRIGATVTLTEIAHSRQVRERFPVLAQAAAEVASPLIQNSATLGGNLLVETRCFFFNQFPGWRQSLGYCLKAEGDECWVVPQKSICYATYSGDLAPVLQVLDASLILAGSSGEREVKAAAFYAPDGIAKNVKSRDEIIREVRIPEASAGLRAAYRKLRIRDTIDFPSMGAAVALRLAGRTIETLRISITAIDVVPLPMDEVTAPLAGRELSDTLITEIAGAVEARCRPLRNVPLTPPYRKKMVGVYVRDLLTSLRDASK
jgi:4-hydroxybenzoyl-CoA reductase subunit beta